ncbi:hypothetical protein ED733_004895 [Metarhizium rileyi]|uniref:T6SS Phospholipase effector Tle1-like catalytic domain-containing protein n=1 Tax=Metarhizium rileyi (strain RCEF 4871) TaxID=1649241 RepID=A0A5C6G7Q3_METRR|nr:hypothetical protein ED733_004895 [Metarhizium rileyi]
MAAEYATARRQKKRLIVCCDGTWMNSDYGFTKSRLFSKKGTLQVPSNVTRISRCFKRRCADGTLQIISYESGVGSGSNTLDSITGGVFGTGLAERVREVYAYLCANYMCGDEIFLVGFSRGAFTARSVSGMIANLGLLTREGVEHFYPIFKDMQNWENDDYDDPFPSVPFRDKPKGPNADVEYRARLEKMGYTRVYQKNNNLIKVKGALALDETRTPFSPAVWERPRRERLSTVDLRQVWFPGNHGNCGGGWDDQGIANATLAWMMDQMTSIGVEFDTPSLRRVIEQTFDFYESPEAQKAYSDRGRLRRWAVQPIFDKNKPIRPWALGSIQKVGGVLYAISGDTIRTPGMYKQVDPKTSVCREKYLQDTNEKVHSSVRVRLACEGLGLNDESVWSCQALSDWKLKRAIFEYDDDDEPAIHDYRPYDRYRDRPSRQGWIWKYAGSERNAPNQRIMPEESLGPYERYVLELSGGRPNVYDYAERRANKSSRRRSRSERARKAFRQGASHTY